MVVNTVPPVPTFSIVVVVIPETVKDVIEPMPPITFVAVVAVPVRLPTKEVAVATPTTIFGVPVNP